MPKDERINLRVSAKVKKTLIARAKKSGMSSLTEYIINAAVHYEVHDAMVTALAEQRNKSK